MNKYILGMATPIYLVLIISIGAISAVLVSSLVVFLVFQWFHWRKSLFDKIGEDLDGRFDPTDRDLEPDLPDDCSGAFQVI